VHPKTDRVRAHYEQLTQSLFTKHADRHYAHPRRRIRDGSTEQMLALRARGWTQATIAARFRLTRGSVQDRLRTATRTLASQRSPRHRRKSLRGIQTSSLYHQVFDAAVLPNPGSTDQYESWAIVCSSAEEVTTIPCPDSLYRTRVQANAGRQRRGGKDAAKAGLDDCLGFHTVRSIVPVVVEPVYDLEVAGDRAFIADGLVVQPGHL
jgi:hypothetical protein